jgi:hypothetical protein
MFFENQFKFNPFSHTAVFDFEDYLRNVYIPLPNVEYMKYELINSIDEEYPIYKLLKGEAGCGKTSALYYLMDSIIKLKRDDVFILDFKNLDSFKGIFGFINCLEEKVLGTKGEITETINKVISITEMQRAIEKAFGTKIYIFIDVMETKEKKILEDFVSILLYLVGCKNIRIIMAMNNGVYENLSNATELVGRSGKIEAREIEYFTEQQTGELIKSRLQKARIDGGDLFFPFNENAIKIIHNYSNGIPRNIITACNTLFTNADSKNIKIVDEKIAGNILKYDYIDGILQDRINDPTRRAVLKELLFVIRGKKGIINSMSELKKEMHNLNGTSPVTVEKRLNELKRIGLVDIRKSRKNNWANEVKLIGGVV